MAAPAKPDKPRLAPLIVSGLGKDVDKLLNLSPTMRDLWAKAKDKGYQIEFRNGPNETDYEKGKIYINPNSFVDGHKLTTTELATLAAHEIEHAANGGGRVFMVPDREGFASNNTRREIEGEAAAALTNARVRDEIKSAGGPDIGIRGGSDKEITDIFERRKSGEIKTDEEARAAMYPVCAKEPRLMKDGSRGTTEQVFMEKHRYNYDELQKK